MMFWPFSLLFPRRVSRYIFQYRDGHRVRSADPVDIEQVIIDHLGEDWRDRVSALGRPAPLGVVGEDATKAATDRATERQKVLEAINAAFGVEAHKDGVGLTQAERFGLLDGYCRFCADLVRIARPFLTAQSRASPGPVRPAPQRQQASTSAAAGSQPSEAVSSSPS